MDNIFVIMRPDGTPFHRDDAMGILATDSEAQAIRFQHAREEEGAEYVRYMRTQPPPAASVSERARDDLHVAICQAVALMNMEPMTTTGLLQAHDILRKAIS